MSARYRKLALAVLAALAGVSCAPEVVLESRVVGEVTVSLTAPAVFRPGDTAPSTVAITDTRGAPMPNAPHTWSSSAPTIASVSATGLVTGVGVGTATITATSGGRTGSATITVVPRVATVAVASSGGSSVMRGATLQLTGTPLGPSSESLTGRSVTWVSSNPAVATVSSGGLVTGVSAGTATITAESEGASGDFPLTVATDVASVTVSAPGGATQIVRGNTITLSATLRNLAGSTLLSRTVTWTSSDTSIATVSAAGVVTGRAQGGPVTIRAESDGVNGTYALTVLTDVATVAVTPSTFTLNTAGHTQQLAATVRNAANEALAGRSIAWTTSNSSVASVSASGLVTVHRPGTATISATVDGVAGAAVATGAACLRMRVTPLMQVDGSLTGTDCGPPTALAIEDNFQLDLTQSGLFGFYVNALSPVGANFQVWRRISPTPAFDWMSTVPSTGGPWALTAYGVGRHLVYARSASTLPVSYGFLVQEPAAGSVNICGIPAVIGGGLSITRQLSTTNGCTLSGFHFDAYYVYLPQGAQISVSVQSASFAGVIAEIWVADHNAGWVRTGMVGFDQQSSGTASFTYNTIHNDGNGGHGFQVIARPATAGTGGTYTISMSITNPVETITVSTTTGSTQVSVGSTLRLEAEARTAQQFTLFGRPVTWSSSNTNVATVSTSGVVTAVAPGTATITATGDGRSGSLPISVVAIP